MRRVHPLATVAGLTDASVDAALASALPTAGAAELPLLVRLLLERGEDKALGEVLRRFHDLPPRVKRDVVRHANATTGAMREAVEAREGGLRRSAHAGAGVLGALEVIDRSRRSDLAYLAAEAMRQPSVRVRRTAAGVLERLARRCRTRASEHRPPRMSAQGARQVAEAVDRAVTWYPAHRQEGVLRAWLWLLPGGARRLGEGSSATVSWESAWGGVVWAELSRMLEAARHPAARRALAAARLIEPLRDAARAGLRRAMRRGDPLPLELGHLLLAAEPQTAPAKPVGDPAASPEVMAAGRALRHLPGLLRLEGPDLAHRVERLQAMSQSRDPAARASALRALTGLIGDAGEASKPTVQRQVERGVAAYVTDVEPALARAALRWLRAVDHEALPTLLVRAMDTGRAELIDFARAMLAQASFERLWSRWDRLDPQPRRAAVEALSKLDQTLPQRLRARVLAGTGGERLRAVAMLEAARGADQATGPTHPEMRALLARLCDDADPRVAAASGEAMRTWGTRGHAPPPLPVQPHEAVQDVVQEQRSAPWVSPLASSAGSAPVDLRQPALALEGASG